MPAACLPLPRCLCAALTCCLLTFTLPLPAATDGFAANLAPAQQTAVGLALLSPTERSALDQLVAADLAQSRHSDLGPLSGTFVARHSEVELKSAGLDRLTPAELTKLNELVAAALAIHPGKRKERPRLKDGDVFNPVPPPEIHGSVSLTVGSGGRGRNFWGSSLWVDYFDPASGLGLSVGVSQFSGKGFYGYRPGGFYPDYYDYGPAYYSGFPLADDTFYRGMSRGDFLAGDGQSFRTFSPEDPAGFGRRHR